MPYGTTYLAQHRVVEVRVAPKGRLEAQPRKLRHARRHFTVVGAVRRTNQRISSEALER